MLRGLLMVAGLGLAVGVAGELVAPGLVEARIEDTVRAHTDEQAAVEAHASGRPFLPRLLLDGRVEGVEVTLREVAGAELTIGTAAVGAEGIHLDRGAMYRGEVRITEVERGTATILIDQAELAEGLGGPVDLDPELVELAGSALRVAGTTVLDVPVDTQLMPCSPDLEVDPPQLRLRCTFAGVPGLLRSVPEG